jgi:hypothetical protein
MKKVFWLVLLISINCCTPFAKVPANYPMPMMGGPSFGETASSTANAAIAPEKDDDWYPNWVLPKKGMSPIILGGRVKGELKIFALGTAIVNGRPSPNQIAIKISGLKGSLNEQGKAIIAAKNQSMQRLKRFLGIKEKSGEEYYLDGFKATQDTGYIVNGVAYVLGEILLEDTSLFPQWMDVEDNSLVAIIMSCGPGYVCSYGIGYAKPNDPGYMKEYNAQEKAIADSQKNLARYFGVKEVNGFVIINPSYYVNGKAIILGKAPVKFN